MKKIYVMSIIFFSGYTMLNAQKSTELDFRTPMPPESYQFKKRLINNVSLYTGQPSISIPLYVINLDGLEVPISLSYNTGGIKTDEDATFVGLGWSLNIGGEINRTNHGALDENYLMATSYDQLNAGIGFLKKTIGTGFTGDYHDFCSGSIYNQIIPYTNFYKNAYYSSDPLGSYESFDTRPDEFFYSIPGHSGKIMFSQKKTKFVTIPFDDIKIEYNLWNSQYGSYIKKNLDFAFTLPDGYKLTFGREGLKSMYKLMTGGRLFDQTWQIGSITSPKGNSILYSYEPVEYQLCKNIQTVTTKIKSTGEVNSEYMNCNEVLNKDNLPHIISFPTGKIQFYYNSRIDLMPGSKRLEKIIIYNSAGLLLKTIELNQSYFEANYNIYSSTNSSYNDIVNKRLRLNSVRIIDGLNNNSNSNQQYSFEYNLYDKIPTKNTKQDHWGYFNGGFYDSFLFPKNKTIHDTYSQTFSLKKIKFPEGGVKEFIYESHKAIPHERVRKYYEDITDDGFEIKEQGFYTSGYSLLNFYPSLSNITMPNYPPGNKVITGNEFEIKNSDKSLSSNEVSLTANSDLPFKVPNYQSLDSNYNYVVFEMQKKTGTSFAPYRYIGKISKSDNISGVSTNLNIESIEPGIYRFIMIIYQPTINSSNSNNINHSSYIRFKYRNKFSDEVRIGGQRIKQINTFTEGNLSVPSYITKYFYNLNDNITSAGKVMNAPDYYEYIHIKGLTNNPIDPNNIGHVLTVRESSQAVTPLYKTSGSNVGYTVVTKTDIDVLNNSEITESNYFTFQDPFYSDISSYSTSRNYEPKDWHRGKLLKKQYFKNNEIIKEDIFEYNGELIEFDMDDVDEITTDLLCISDFDCTSAKIISKHIQFGNSYAGDFTQNQINQSPQTNIYSPIDHTSTFLPYRKIYSGFDRIKSKTTIDYMNGIPTLTKKENFTYYNNIYRQLEKQNTIFADNLVSETTFKYAQEEGNQLMISKNMIGIPLETTTTQTIGGTTKTLSKTETIYPTSQSEANTKTSGLVLPTSFLSYDLQNVTSSTTEVTYDKYDSKGNIQQYTTKDGIPTAIIWGYNSTQPIAKIVGATYAQVSSLATAIISASDTDASAAPGNDETAILTALDNFRKDSSMAGYQITTYTYDPLIGVTSITPPSGIREVYLYDTANRLKEIREGSQTGKLLKEFKYNYKN